MPSRLPFNRHKSSSSNHLIRLAGSRTNTLVGYLERFFSEPGRWYVFLGALSFVLLAGNAYIFYPGFMSLDSVRQLAQALGQDAYRDWHPPVMAWVWSILIAVTGKISSMLIAQLLLLWISLLLLAVYLYKLTGRRRWSLLPLLIGVLPGTIAISGVIWKDVQLAFVLLLAFCLSLYIRSLSRRLQILVGSIIGLCLAYALLLRYNAVLAVLPIAYFAASQVINGHRIRLATLGVFVVMSIGFGAVLNHALAVQESNPAASVMLDDIVNIVPRVATDPAVSSVPKPLQDSLASIQQACRRSNTVINSYGYCTTSADKNMVTQQHFSELRSLWIESITSHPLRYVGYKLRGIGIFLTTPERYVYIMHPGIDANKSGLDVSNRAAADVSIDYVGFFHKELGILFRAYFWLIAAAALFLYARRLASHTLAVQCLTVSAIAYIVGYFPIVVAADYRYIYWSVLATLVAGLLTLADTRSRVRAPGATKPTRYRRR